MTFICPFLSLRIFLFPLPARQHISRGVPPPVPTDVAPSLEEAQAAGQRRKRGEAASGGQRVAALQRSTIR